MSNAALTNILLSLVLLGLGVVIRVLFSISAKVNKLDVDSGKQDVRMGHVESEIKELKLKIS